MCVCMFTTAGVNIHVHMPVKVGSYCVCLSQLPSLCFIIQSLLQNLELPNAS